MYFCLLPVTVKIPSSALNIVVTCLSSFAHSVVAQYTSVRYFTPACHSVPRLAGCSGVNRLVLNQLPACLRFCDDSRL